MAYYRNYGKEQTRDQKRRRAESRGGFGDEGSRYSSRTSRAPGDEDARARTRSSYTPGKARPAPGRFSEGHQTEGPSAHRTYAPRDRQPYSGREEPRRFGSPAGRGQPAPARYSGRYQREEPATHHTYAPRDRQPYDDREETRRYGSPAGKASHAPLGYLDQRNQGGVTAGHPYTNRAQRTQSGRAEAYHYVPPVVKTSSIPVEKAEAFPAENLLSGRNPIREALKAGRDIEKLLVARGELSGSAREIVRMARDRHIPVQEVDRARLDAITSHHQGMLAFASAYQYSTVQNMLSLAAGRGESPFLVVLDGVTDPHNLGAIIRTAECAGAHGVIVQERRAAGLTPSAVKASAGAIEYLPVARVINLTAILDELKRQGVWIYAADSDGEDYHKVDLSGAVALVIGAEGEGISRRVLENCDRRLALPIRGQIGSLNASVAAGILMYAVMGAR